MKIKIERLREIVREKIQEAAAEGKFQSYAKGSFSSMISLLGKGGNKNTPPFKHKAAKAGKSGPDDSGYTA
tara:strand:+ start:4190 stop:4402 length:213 start_codon:yes stop_codon:yes gene_type:complete